MIYEMKLQPAYYDFMLKGTKRIEIRLNDEKRKDIKVGDKIKFYKEPDLKKYFLTEVVEILKFNNFEEMIDNLKIEELAAKSLTKEELLGTLEKYYSQEKQKKYGVLGIRIKLLKKDRNISKISLNYNQIDKDKINKILTLLNIDKMVCYIDDEFNKNFYEILNNLGISYIEKFNDIFNQIFLKLDKKMYLKLYGYMQERDVLISSINLKEDWQSYLSIFTNEVCLGMLSYDTNCILEIDDYEKVISVQFRKEEYNSKELIKNVKSILR